MLSIAHGVTGAVLATALPLPAFYIPLAVGLHYVEDWTPHWDVGTGLSSGKRTVRTALLLESVDLLILLALLYVGWWNFGPEVFAHAAVGAFAALIPDFLEAPRNFLHREPAFLRPFSDFHNSLHHSIPTIWLGILPQILLLCFCWWFLGKLT